MIKKEGPEKGGTSYTSVQLILVEIEMNCSRLKLMCIDGTTSHQFHGVQFQGL